jgi:hypothetical protein
MPLPSPKLRLNPPSPLNLAPGMPCGRTSQFLEEAGMMLAGSRRNGCLLSNSPRNVFFESVRGVFRMNTHIGELDIFLHLNDDRVHPNSVVCLHGIGSTTEIA